MSELRAALHTSIDVGLGGVLLANMLAGWLDGDPKVLPQNITGANRPTFIYASRRRAKSVIIKRAQSASMHCGRKRWNWAGANP
jgi:hypothetical protein